MGAKGTKIPPSALQVWLDKKGANPGKWPPDNWQPQKAGSAGHCEPTNPSVLTEEHINGYPWPLLPGSYPPISPNKPLSYLYKPETEGPLGDGWGRLNNLFILPGAGIIPGAILKPCSWNKVLVFVTGSAVGPGDVPGLDCTDIWQNRVYTAFNSVAGTYASTVPDFVNDAGDGPWTITDDFTFSAWIKPQAGDPEDSNLQYIANHLYCAGGPTCATRWAMWRDTDESNRLFIQIGREGAKRVARTTLSLADDTWYHVAFTWWREDAFPTIGYLDAYVDGVPVPITNTVLEPLYPSEITYGKLIVGARGDSEDDEGSVASDFWSGSMDELSYWNTNLNAAEVYVIFSSSQYCSDGPGNLNMHSAVDNLVAWWRMGEDGNDSPGLGSPGIPDLAPVKGAEPNNLYIPAEPNNPSFQSEDFLSGALASSGLYIGKPPWIRVTGTFPNGNENLIMLPGARVELTWNPYPVGKPTPSGYYQPQPGNFWSTDIMHSGCYSCSTLGPKAYLTGPLDMTASLRAWPPP